VTVLLVQPESNPYHVKIRAREKFAPAKRPHDRVDLTDGFSGVPVGMRIKVSTFYPANGVCWFWLTLRVKSRAAL
jgi:hypothetical protein